MEAGSTLRAELREEVGGAAAKRLRRKGLVPAVLYGKGMETKVIAVAGLELASVLDHGHRLVKVRLGGEEVRAVIKEAQYDALGDGIIHADFHKVVAGEKISLMAEVLVVGEAAGMKVGGILEQPTREVEVECTVENLVESIEVDISKLEMGDTLHVRDLEVPAGVKVLNDPDEVLVSITAPREEVEEELVVEEKEPEVIGEAERAEEGKEEGGGGEKE